MSLFRSKRASAASRFTTRTPSTPSLSPIVVALLGLLGVAVGGAIQYFSSRAVAQSQRLLELKLTAYGEYVAAQAALQRAQTPPEQEAANRQVRAAAFKTVMFGDPNTIQRLAAFVRDSGSRQNCVMPPSDIAVYQSMRGDALGHDVSAVSDADVAMALFGCVLGGVSK